MNASLWIRRFHRWMSIAFFVAVVANIAAQGHEKLALWVGLATLVPLALLLITGLYLFALPYVSRAGQARRASA